MCKLVVINKLYLGNRELGYELFDLNKLEVVEMTAGQIKLALKAGKEILGVKVSAGNELVLDKEKYFMNNLMKKVHINKLEPLYEAENSLANIFYYVVGVCDKNGKRYYNVVNSRFGRTKMTEDLVKAYIPIGIIAGGVKIENNEIIVSDLIKPADKKSEPITEVKVKPEVLETKVETSKVEEVKPEDSKKEESKIEENPLDEKIVSVEIEKVAKPKAGDTKTQKSKK